MQLAECSGWATAMASPKPPRDKSEDGSPVTWRPRASDAHLAGVAEMNGLGSSVRPKRSLEDCLGVIPGACSSPL